MIKLFIRLKSVEKPSATNYNYLREYIFILTRKGELYMEKGSLKYNSYVQILKEELVPAMGCTEPVAIAYCASEVREVLQNVPDRIKVSVSPNIVKNVKSVIVPNTNGLKGIESAVAAGIIAGKPLKKLEAISSVSEEEKNKMREYLDKTEIEVQVAETPYIVFIEITGFYGDDYSTVRIANYHTNIMHVEKNGKVLFEKETGVKEDDLTDRSVLNVKDIVDFANTVDISDIRQVISQQIDFNTRISEEGLKNNYGANIGKVTLATYGNAVSVRARAAAAAGSDARMNGCSLPVVIVSGSGNQGMTASLPVIEYAKELKVSEEKMYRALVLSNLITIHQKTGIGRLSAFCGAISAGCGSGAAIAYLHGEGYEGITRTIVNALGIVSGTICDGAKASCAAKISAAVDAGIIGFEMYKKGQEFKGGDGILNNDVEATIVNIGILAKEGMKETDKEILKIMITNCC